MIVTNALPQNRSTSMTNVPGYLAPELVRRHYPPRFEAKPPAIFRKHQVEERTPEGRPGPETSWNRLPFHSWALRL